VAALSAAGEEPIEDVTWSRRDGAVVTEEFRVDADLAADHPELLGEAEPVVDVGEERVFQFERPADADCACSVVEALDYPLADVRVEDGELRLTLHLEDRTALREIVAELDDVAERVAVRYLVQGTAEGDGGGDAAVVDRGRLTERQREVLATAHEMGYFEYPGGANATQVAESLDITVSTFSEHLSRAQSRLLADLLGAREEAA